MAPRRSWTALSATFALCALLGGPVLGQPDGRPVSAPPQHVHEVWTVEDGLPVNSVLDVFQDRNGYLWLTTFDGLVRFDGVQFTVFTTGNTPGLTTNRLLGLVQSQDGTLWIRTEDAGLIAYRSGAFTVPAQLPPGQVDQVFEDRQGTLWVISEKGLFRLEGERFVAADLVPGRAQVIHERRSGEVWIGVKGGVYVLGPNGPPRLLPLPGSPAVDVNLMLEDRRGTLWIGTSGGLFRARGDSLARFTTGDGLPDPHVNDLAEDHEGNIWVNTHGGLCRMHGAGFVAEKALAGVSTHSVYVDGEGSLWVGTITAGLHQLKPALFTIYGAPEGVPGSVHGLFEARDGAVWIGTGSGLFRLRQGVIEGNALPGVSAWAIQEDRSGDLWVGDYSAGLYRLRNGGRVAHYGAAEGLTHGSVRAIHEDWQGRLWIGTYGGLFRYENDRFKLYTETDGLSHNWVRCIYESRDGSLWLCTNGGGLTRYRDGRFTTLTTQGGLSSDKVRAVYEDEDGVLWVGTEGHGLNRVQGARVTVYTTGVGLFDDGIHQILEDDFGRLWMSTNRGIFWVARSALNTFAEGRIRSVESTSYTERHGLRNREANGGFQHAGIRSRDGRLWFPTVDGVAVTDPAHLGRNRQPPPVVIEQVQAGEAVFRLLEMTEQAFDLAPNQRDLEIRYAGLSFVAPERVRFRYRLEGYDNDWVEAGTRRTALYTNVPPGAYTFQVIAANSDGVWNAEEASVALTIAPFVHETTWFWMLCALALGLAVAGAYRARMRQVKAQQQALERLVEDRTHELREAKQKTEEQAHKLLELDHLKSEFFANVSHEFRTPLTLTIGPLEDVLDAPAPGMEHREQIELALVNARRLLRLVNQLLDLAKLEAGRMELQAARGDVVAFTRQIATAFSSLAERHHIAFGFNADEASTAAYFDRDKLEKVLLNLLSNAFKFTPEGGHIQVRVRVRRTGGEEAGRVEIAVRDSGAGIPEESLPRLFDRFYQAGTVPARPHEGSGIGLALSRELMLRHGGAIRVESREGSGSTFTVSLPLGRAHLASDEVVEPSGDALPQEPVVRAQPVEGEAVRLPSAAQTPASARVRMSPDRDVPAVLIVDDHPAVRAYVRQHCEPQYRVLEAGDGEEGLQAAREHLPDLIISDVMMPRMDGYVLCRALKESRALDFIPLILLTARAEAEDRLSGFGLGADDYLTKPFEMKELLARVKNLIRSRERLRASFMRAAVQALPGDEAPSTDEVFLQQVRTGIEAHLAEAGFGVESLAEAVGLSRAQLYRRVQALTGQAPGDLIREVRLLRAAQLLATHAGTVSEVAYGVGFSSLSYFSRCFRKQFGMLPSDYTRSEPGA